MTRILLALALSATCLSAPSAIASSSERHDMEGGSLRLVTSGLADKDGLLRGALVIELWPGWKTYWRDPGSSGVPPQIGVGESLNVTGAELYFPAPEWHEDSYGDWAGYDHSVALPVTFAVPEPDRFSFIEADVFLGVCETICVPVQAELTVEPGSSPDDPEDRKIVEAAFASLPSSASADFGISRAELSGEELVIDAAVPADAGEVDLFVAGGGGYLLGTFKPVQAADGKVAFTVPVLSRPDPATGKTKLPYTLVSRGGAVSGEIILP